MLSLLEMAPLLGRDAAPNPVTIDFAPGEASVITGPSGAGKSLFLRAIADLDPSRGRVLLNGADRDAMPAPVWRRRVGYLAADSGWWADRVSDHFDDPDRAAAYFSRLGLRPELMDATVERLSTGEKHRLALIRFLVLDPAPAVLLLDEPTGPLDADSEARVETLLRERMDQGAIVIMISHDAAQADRLATRRFRVERGQLSEVSP